jgi:hypothetical protein
LIKGGRKGSWNQRCDGKRTITGKEIGDGGATKINRGVEMGEREMLLFLLLSGSGRSGSSDQGISFVEIDEISHLQEHHPNFIPGDPVCRPNQTIREQKRKGKTHSLRTSYSLDICKINDSP